MENNQCRTTTLLKKIANLRGRETVSFHTLVRSQRPAMPKTGRSQSWGCNPAPLPHSQDLSTGAITATSPRAPRQEDPNRSSGRDLNPGSPLGQQHLTYVPAPGSNSSQRKSTRYSPSNGTCKLQHKAGAGNPKGAWESPWAENAGELRSNLSSKAAQEREPQAFFHGPHADHT